jgi:hypothetical protein
VTDRSSSGASRRLFRQAGERPLGLASVAAFALLAGGSPSFADDAPATPAPAKAEERSLQGYAAQAPHCLEWTDGCAVCARGAEAAESHCSTPGVACQPSAIQCSKP